MTSIFPTIAVDDRQDKDFTEALRSTFTVQVKHMRTGDFTWWCPLGVVGVEDKCSDDLTNSRTNGRLDDELRRLHAMYTLPVLFVRDTARSRFSRWTDASVENLLLGRQMHGILVYRSGGRPEDAAEALHNLWAYTQRLRPGGVEGVRREAALHFAGPLSSRAECIYHILGGVTGIRGRRAVASAIAQRTPVSELLHWKQMEFEAAGFSRLMSAKLADHVRNMEETIN